MAVTIIRNLWQSIMTPFTSPTCKIKETPHFTRTGLKSRLREVRSPLVLQPATRSLRQAGAVLKRCEAFLSVDTSLMHIAAAVAVPTQIVIETPTFNKTIEPFGRAYRLVTNPAVAGRNLDYYRYDGGGIRGTRDEILRCMASVKVDAVYRVLESALPPPAATAQGKDKNSPFGA